MNVILTSCGLETKRIEDAFTEMLPKPPSEIRAMFIPTAAVFPDAIDVLPECLNDLRRCGIKDENIVINDLHAELKQPIGDAFDVVYLCGGDTKYLLKRINEQGFNQRLLEFISGGGIVMGVSAGSVIFAGNLPDNLGLLKCSLGVHVKEENRTKAGPYPRDREEKINLGNWQAILFQGDSLVIIE